MHFPEQPLDWGYLLDSFAAYYSYCTVSGTCGDRMKFLIMCGMSDPVEALAFKVWRDCVVSMIHSAQYKYADDEYVHDENLYLINRIRAKVAHFEDELPKLKEITTILELALWKLRMNEIIPRRKQLTARRKSKLMNGA